MQVIYVPTDYSTISAAINAASSGDTIKVAAGVYKEQVIINKTLTIYGAQHDTDARTRPFIAANESIITFNGIAGSGTVNIQAPDVVFSGFTVQNDNKIDSTCAIFAGDIPSFLPQTKTIDVTGLQLLNNIIQNNANGVLIASIEPKQKSPNYTVQHNFLYNNNGDAGSANGQGVFFNNSAGIPMSNVLITENLFNGLESSASINLAYVSDSTISDNVMNNDNSIAIFGTTNVYILRNITYNATGSAIYISNSNGSGCTDTFIDRNIVMGSISNGINIDYAVNGLTITNNCIKNNKVRGIKVNTSDPPSSNITIQNNNIAMNGIGLDILPSSFTLPPAFINAVNNYWNSPSGPNYNGTGPGTGDTISDKNSVIGPSVVYTPFSTTGFVCYSPLTVTKTTPNTTVSPGDPISFVVSLLVKEGVNFVITSFKDILPALNSGNSWKIIDQTPSGFFNIIGSVGSQSLSLVNDLPLSLVAGTYTVTISALTSTSDAGETFSNTCSVDFLIGGQNGLSQTLSATADPDVNLCIHASSRILLANGKSEKICQLSRNEKIQSADGKQVSIIQVVPCWAGFENRIFGKCILFGVNSLAPGVPNAMFAVDAGHPIATPNDYKLKGNNALKPAQFYFQRERNRDIVGIRETTWDKVADLFQDKNARFDIIMAEDSCKAYIANGVVVKARENRKNPGYRYE